MKIYNCAIRTSDFVITQWEEEVEAIGHYYDDYRFGFYDSTLSVVQGKSSRSKDDAKQLAHDFALSFSNTLNQAAQELAGAKDA